jgi:hypothetical protein
MLPYTGETVSYTDLPPAEPDSQVAVEWETYRREVGRLLSEGHEGRFVLIKREAIVGLYETAEAARAEGYRRYQLQGFLVHHILGREPLIRAPNWLQIWHAARSQSRQTG